MIADAGRTTRLPADGLEKALFGRQDLDPAVADQNPDGSVRGTVEDQMVDARPLEHVGEEPPAARMRDEAVDRLVPGDPGHGLGERVMVPMKEHEPRPAVGTSVSFGAADPRMSLIRGAEGVRDRADPLQVVVEQAGLDAAAADIIAIEHGVGVLDAGRPLREIDPGDPAFVSGHAHSASFASMSRSSLLRRGQPRGPVLRHDDHLLDRDDAPSGDRQPGLYGEDHALLERLERPPGVFLPLRPEERRPVVGEPAHLVPERVGEFLVSRGGEDLAGDGVDLDPRNTGLHGPPRRFHGVHDGREPPGDVGGGLALAGLEDVERSLHVRAVVVRLDPEIHVQDVARLHLAVGRRIMGGGRIGPGEDRGTRRRVPGGDEAAPRDLGGHERGDLLLRPARPDESGDQPEDVLGRPDGLPDAADLGCRFALPEGGNDPFGGFEPVGHADLRQEAAEGQVHAVGQSVAGLAFLGIVDGDAGGSDLLQIFLERLPDAGDEAHDTVPGPRLLDRLLVIEADDGPRPSVAPDDERRMPRDVGRDEERQDRVAVDRALPGERDPAVDAELPEQACGLPDFLANQGHVRAPFRSICILTESRREFKRARAGLTSVFPLGYIVDIKETP